MNLKKYLDAVNTAEARVQQIAAQIDEYLEADKTEEALALKSQLDEAKAKAKEASDIYLLKLNVNDDGQEKHLTPVGGDVQVTRDAADQPFKNDGEFFMAVKTAGLFPGREDQRLLPLRYKDVADGLNEGVPSEGGYLLTPQTNSKILEKMYSIGEILRRVSMDPIGPNSNSMLYNGVDETSRVTGSRWGGVRGYWVAEATDITGSHPKWYQFEVKPKKVGALCYATDEQLQDTVNLASWLNRVVPDELRFQAEDAIYEGDGVGKPLGMLLSPSLISVLRYATSTISYIDVVNMWSRRWAGVSDYVWLINQDVTPQLDSMYVTSGVPVPPNFFAYGPDGVMRMKGKEVLEVEYAQSMGTVGDILLASLSQYQAASKGDVQSVSSIHVEFEKMEEAFRFALRLDGQPSWHSALTPLHGSTTHSPFVALATATA
jgi:HK97 family phage major capsid protein